MKDMPHDYSKNQICASIYLLFTLTGFNFGKPCAKRVPSSSNASNMLSLASTGLRSEGIDILSLLKAEIRGS